MKQTYVVTVDFYNNDDGHGLQVLCVTEDLKIAKSVLKDYVDDHREFDEEDGYSVLDDTEGTYYAYGTMPNYHRVQINVYESDYRSVSICGSLDFGGSK